MYSCHPDYRQEQGYSRISTVQDREALKFSSCLVKTSSLTPFEVAFDLLPYFNTLAVGFRIQHLYYKISIRASELCFTPTLPFS